MNVLYLCDKQNPECEKTNCGGDYCHHTTDVNHAVNFKPIVDQASGEVIGYMEKESVELDESVIQEVLNKRCMTAVANEYLVALHGKGSQGEWKRHDMWKNGEYIGGFYHVNCPCEDGYYSKWETNFCPNCGQPMMKGGAENEKTDK